jgi:hypothetical protein
MSNFPWAKFAGLTLGLLGFGYGLMKATTPNEEQLYKELAPDLKRKVDASRAARLAREAEMKRLLKEQNAEATQTARAQNPNPQQ